MTGVASPRLAAVTLVALTAPIAARPFLLPRRPRDQALLSGVVAGGAFVTGLAAEGAAGLIATRVGGAGRARLALAAAAGVVTVGGVVVARSHRTAGFSIASAGAIAGAGAVSGMVAGAGLRGNSALALGALTLGTAATTVAMAGRPRTPAARVVAGDGRWSGAAAALGAAGVVAGGGVALAAARSSVLDRFTPTSAAGRVAWQAAVGAAVLAVAAGGALGARSLLGVQRVPPHRRNSVAPSADLAVATNGSNAPVAADSPGARFLATRPSRRWIAATARVAPRDVQSPLRRYVRLDDSAATECARAIADLRAAGAFRRRAIVVYVAPDGGHVDATLTATAEALLHGDVASVALSHAGGMGNLVGWRTASQQTARVATFLTQLDAQLRREPAGHRPRVVVVGYSVGAWAGADAFAANPQLPRDMVGLWLGAPAASSARRSSLAAGSNAAVVATTGDAAHRALDRRRGTGPLHGSVFLDHVDDPVAATSPQMLVDPRAMHDAIPGDADPAWIPIVSGLQAGVDMMRGGQLLTPRQRRVGHDYRPEAAALLPHLLGIDVDARDANAAHAAAMRLDARAAAAPREAR